jgi:hypothetical protein
MKAHAQGLVRCVWNNDWVQVLKNRNKATECQAKLTPTPNESLREKQETPQNLEMHPCRRRKNALKLGSTSLSLIKHHILIDAPS